MNNTSFPNLCVLTKDNAWMDQADEFSTLLQYQFGIMFLPFWIAEGTNKDVIGFRDVVLYAVKDGRIACHPAQGIRIIIQKSFYDKIISGFLTILCQRIYFATESSCSDYD